MRVVLPVLFGLLALLVAGRRRRPVDDEPGMAAWFATVLEEIDRFGR
jgi:hypothetical protein